MSWPIPGVGCGPPLGVPDVEIEVVDERHLPAPLHMRVRRAPLALGRLRPPRHCFLLCDAGQRHRACALRGRRLDIRACDLFFLLVLDEVPHRDAVDLRELVRLGPGRLRIFQNAADDGIGNPRCQRRNWHTMPALDRPGGSGRTTARRRRIRRRPGRCPALLSPSPRRASRAGAPPARGGPWGSAAAGTPGCRCPASACGRRPFGERGLNIRGRQRVSTAGSEHPRHVGGLGRVDALRLQQGVGAHVYLDGQGEDVRELVRLGS